MGELSEEQKRKAAEISQRNHELDVGRRERQAQYDKEFAAHAAEPWHKNLLNAIGIGNEESPAKKKER